MRPINESIAARADQCVRCGLCLPHCPTYRLNKEEPESPRGRIALLAAYARAELDWQPSLQQHVDQCLACGHCERVCPAVVHYSELLIEGRALLAQAHPISWKKKLAVAMIQTPWLRRLCFLCICSIQKMRLWRGLLWITKQCAPRFAQMISIIPRIYPSHFKVRSPLPLSRVCGRGVQAAVAAPRGKGMQESLSVFESASSSVMGIVIKRQTRIFQNIKHHQRVGCDEKCGHSPTYPLSRGMTCGGEMTAFPITHQRVLLAPGCTGENFGAATLNAAQQLLSLWGMEVIRPPQALCCGALSAHAGLSEQFAKQTMSVLSDFCLTNGITQIIMCATGCSSFAQKIVRAHHDLSVIDIQQFLLDHWPKKHDFFSSTVKPLRIAVHSPCTQTNALRHASLSQELLKRLPNVELIPFGIDSCCGSAGGYFLEHPEISEKLIAQLLTEELLDACDLIVTSNIGCQLHMQHFLRTKKINRMVCHPIEVVQSSAASDRAFYIAAMQPKK